MLPDNIMGSKILKRKCACGSSFVKIIWMPLSLKMSTTLREFSHPAFFLQKLSENKEMQKLRRTVEVIFFILTLFIVFGVLSSLVASVMLSIYATLSSHVLAIRERKWR